MRPVNIVLLVLAGAIGGAVVMKVMQRPRPAEVAEVETSAPEAVAPAAPAVVPAVVPEPVIPAPVAEPEPPAEPTAAAESSHKKDRPGGLSFRRPAIVPPRRVEYQHSAERRNASPVRATSAPTLVAQAQAAETPAARPPALQTPPLTPEQPKETPPGNMEPQEVTPVPAQIPAPPEPHTVTLNAGMLIPVRLVDTLSLERNHAGDQFSATLDNELDADGFVIAERGARVEGKVVIADGASKTLSIELTRVRTSDRQDVAIQTERFDKRSEPDHAGDATKVGAGAGGVISTRKPVTLPSEIRITFRLRAPVTITERRD